ncbi:hypothetical protein EV126DRAFT_438860 [Verticillium dahliae]|nr:hypothetical protein EV126DRAFT_439874 [Verticillium dahliae]KAH6708578.1 hypothetical protein EV126DRAFT_438860 [Verticillium dahliae]
MSRRLLPNLAEGSLPNSLESTFGLDAVPSQRGRRQRASAACHECRKQKTKTPQQSFQRKYGELEARNSDLEYMFSFLRHGPETDVHVVLRRIRDGAGLKSLGNHIREGSLLLQLAHHGEVV